MGGRNNSIAEDEKQLGYLFEDGLSDEKKYQRLLDAAWSLNNKGYSDYMAWESGFGNKKDVWQKNRKNKDAINRLIVYYGSYIDFYDGDRDESYLPHGRGTIKYHETGEKYEGGFEHGNRNGYGELFDRNGRKLYEGLWRDNLYNGKGMLYSPNGNITEGTWINGRLQGHFSVMLADGGTVDGDTDENGSIASVGTCYYPNGDSLYCEFTLSDNTVIPCGKGEYNFFDGSTLSGVWNGEGKRDGKFILKKTNGIVMEYTYRNGKLVARKKIRLQ